MSFSSSSENAGAAGAPRKFRVLLVDDHPVTRQGMRVVLANSHALEVCGEADGRAAALQLVVAAKPDLAVVDIALGPANGILLASELKELAPALRILVLSMHEETTYAERALRAGASGYLMKHEAGDKLVGALQQLVRGELFVSARVHERLQRRIVPKRSAETVLPFDTLSDREREVFGLIGDGYSTRQIGERLQLSSKTIDSYRDHLKLKLGFDSGAALVRHAIEWGRTKGPF